MPDSNVYRKESTRWVAPKTSYDGDDWGNEYDEWDADQSELNGIEEESEPEKATPPKATLSGKSISVRRRPVGDTVNKEQEVKEKEMKEKEIREKEQEERELNEPLHTSGSMSPSPAFGAFKSPSTPVVSSSHDTPPNQAPKAPEAPSQNYAMQGYVQTPTTAPPTEEFPSRGLPSDGSSTNGSTSRGPDPHRSSSHGSEKRSISHGSATSGQSRGSESRGSELQGSTIHKTTTRSSETHATAAPGSSAEESTTEKSTHRSEPYGSELYGSEPRSEPQDRQGSETSSDVGTLSTNSTDRNARSDARTTSADLYHSPQSMEESEAEADDDSDNSIQDIYGFYENRYSVAPPGEAEINYSDSTTSLSTGIRSFDSGPSNGVPLSERNGSNETPRSTETHWEQPQEEYHHNHQEDSDETPEEEIPQIAGLNLTKHTPQASLDTTSKEPPSGSPSSSLTSTSLHERPYSQFFDEDLAELYNGSSEFLNRPISTYNAPPIASKISSDSIRELLTPRLQQEGFSSETPTASTPTHSLEPQIPSLFVTSASPEKGEKADMADKAEKGRAAEEPGFFTSKPRSSFENDLDYVDKPETAAQDDEDEDENEDKKMKERETRGKQPEQVGETKPLRDFTHDLDYVDKDEDDEGDEDSSSVYNAVSTEATNAKETFILPSEKNRLASLNSLGSSSYTGDRTQEMDTESTKEPTNELAKESTRESQPHAELEPTNSAADSQATTKAVPASQSPFSPGQLPFTPQQPPAIPAHSAAHPPVQPPHQSDRSTQSIASKVKRPPHVDFGALMNNNNVSSETLCEQMQLLRNREAAYSAGLETWLLATLRNVDPNMKVYTNGRPPAGDTSLLDLPASAKMSNAMHTSASKTQEKLGNLGEKSKSFFAKVIR